MADVTVTTGYPKLIGTLGQLSVYLWKLTDIDDTETLATGLGDRILAHMVQWDGNPGTQAAGGGNSTNSSGTITFYPSTDNLGADVIVLATGM